MGTGACLLDSPVRRFESLVKDLRGKGYDWKRIQQEAKELGLMPATRTGAARRYGLDPIGLRTPKGEIYSRSQLQKARARAIEKAGLAEESKLSDLEIAVREAARESQTGRRAGNFHGNSKDRRISREKLAAEFGDGTYAPCVHCGTKLHVDDISRDKIIPGAEGGRYTHENLIPACYSCNSSRQDKPLRLFWRKFAHVVAA